MFGYALAIFLGAFLLFQVQPLIGKYILPWFGGSPGVWTTCMLFFQVLLLGGYAYAHLVTTRLKPRAQAVLHGVLLLAALAWLPIIPSNFWKPAAGGNPVLQILWLLTACLGLPYFALATTGPLMQQWFARINPGASPYRLYALSNGGSLLALLSYPFFFEPRFTRVAQARLWGWGLGVYALAAGWGAYKLWRTNPISNPEPLLEAHQETAPAGFADNQAPRRGDRVLWVLLPACASVLLLAVTNKLCQDIAVMPFLWVLPLVLYLMSFVVAFDNPRWYRRTWFTLALVAGLWGVSRALALETDLELKWQLGAYALVLFVGCMICHGELYRLRPAPRHLTLYYLMIATGGALGGGFVAVLAPRIFADYYELHWSLLLCGGLLIWVWARETRMPARDPRWLAGALTVAVLFGLDRALVWINTNYPDAINGHLLAMRVGWWGAMAMLAALWLARNQFQTFTHWRLMVCFWLGLGWVVLAGAFWFQVSDFAGKIVTRSRNFYGTLRVCEYQKDDADSHYFLLEHGRITHGLQFVNPTWARVPTTYYGGSNGLALAFLALPSQPRKVGVVGLGTGTTTAYGRPGDQFKIYEINPEVLRLASSRFTYLSNCAAHVEIQLGDARLVLEQEAPQHFDLLTLDAFSSDAIPVHLLTKEAFGEYERHLRTNGVIAVHISNRYLDLEPVVRNAAREFHYEVAKIEYEEDSPDDEDAEWWVYSSTWMLLTRNRDWIQKPLIQTAVSPAATNAPTIPLWTDDFASIFQLLQ